MVDTVLMAMRLGYWDFCSEGVLEQVLPDGYAGIELEHAAVEKEFGSRWHPHKGGKRRRGTG